MGKKHIAIFAAACAASLVLGVGLGYLLFGGAHVKMNTSAGKPTRAAAPIMHIPEAKSDYHEALPATVYPLEDDESAEQGAHRYIVTVVDGYVAVYFADQADGLYGDIKEITTIPATTLPPADKESLENGIRVYTDEALSRVLEDYGS